MRLARLKSDSLETDYKEMNCYQNHHQQGTKGFTVLVESLWKKRRINFLREQVKASLIRHQNTISELKMRRAPFADSSPINTSLTAAAFGSSYAVDFSSTYTAPSWHRTDLPVRPPPPHTYSHIPPQLRKEGRIPASTSPSKGGHPWQRPKRAPRTSPAVDEARTLPRDARHWTFIIEKPPPGPDSSNHSSLPSTSRALTVTSPRTSAPLANPQRVGDFSISPRRRPKPALFPVLCERRLLSPATTPSGGPLANVGCFAGRSGYASWGERYERPGA